MTKTLRMKFIVTAMTAVSILLILLIGGINIANFSVNERMTRDFLKVLAENGGSLSDREPPDELKERPADPFSVSGEWTSARPDGIFLGGNGRRRDGCLL